MDRTLCSILINQKLSRKTAIVCPNTGKSLSYSELHMATKKLADEIIAESFQPNSPVALLFHPSIEFSVAFFAVLYCGGIAVPLDRFVKKMALQTMIDYMQPSLIITSESFVRRIPASILNHNRIIVIQESSITEKDGTAFGENDNSGVPPKGIKRLGPVGYKHVEQFKIPHLTGPDSDAVFIATSGTTGRPKFVRLSHHAVLKNIEMHYQSLEVKSALNGIQTLELNYSYGLIASFLTILYAGGTVVFAPRFEIPYICHQIRHFDINFWVGTPFLFGILAEKIDSNQLKLIRSLERIIIGGDHSPPAMRKSIVEKLSGVSINITYGLTEAGPRVSTLRPQHILTNSLSVGFPLDEVQIRIADIRNNVNCDVGDVGHVLIKSPTLMSGYYREPELSRKKIRNKTLYTGDLGRIDKDGFLYIQGRLDDRFKFRGRRINPKEIENCITSLYGAFHARVTKIDLDGSACIQAEIRIDNDTLNTDAVRRHCKRHLPMYMVPSQFVLIPPSEYYFKGRKVIFS